MRLLCIEHRELPAIDCFLLLDVVIPKVLPEERVPGEVVFRVIRFGDISHLESAGVARSTAGLYPECYTGVDSTDPRDNLELPWVL